MRDDAVDGIYSMTFRGAADWGMGALVLRRGTVSGADTGGGLFDGTYADAGDQLVLDLMMTVPAGLALVVGTPPAAAAPAVSRANNG